MRKVTANNYVECQRDSIGKVVTRENEGGTRGLEKNHHYRIPIHLILRRNMKYVCILYAYRTYKVCGEWTYLTIMSPRTISLRMPSTSLKLYMQ